MAPLPEAALARSIGLRDGGLPFGELTFREGAGAFGLEEPDGSVLSTRTNVVPDGTTTGGGSPGGAGHCGLGGMGGSQGANCIAVGGNSAGRLGGGGTSDGTPTDEWCDGAIGDTPTEEWFDGATCDTPTDEWFDGVTGHWP